VEEHRHVARPPPPLSGAGLEYEAYLLHQQETNYISDNRGTWRAPMRRRSDRPTHMLSTRSTGRSTAAKDGGVSEGPEFYDAPTPTRPAAARAYQDTPMRDLYDAVYSKIKRLNPVVDLGCGTDSWRSASSKGYCGEYRGLDFSRQAINEAVALLDATDAYSYPAEDELPEAVYEFDVQDLRGWKELPEKETHITTYVALEVLEHLEDDIDLVARVPPARGSSSACRTSGRPRTSASTTTSAQRSPASATCSTSTAGSIPDRQPARSDPSL